MMWLRKNKWLLGIILIALGVLCAVAGFALVNFHPSELNPPSGAQPWYWIVNF